MSRNMVAVVSLVLLVLFAASLILIPVPSVAWCPGWTVDVMGSTDEGLFIEIPGTPTGNGGGRLLVTTVSTTRVDPDISLPEVLLAHIAADSDVLPREVAYPADKSNAEVQNKAIAMMDFSRVNAIVVTLRATGQTVIEMPMVSSVSLPGPANGQLRPGDLIEAVDGSEVTTNEGVKTVIQTRAVGDPIVFRVMRSDNSKNVMVTTITERDDAPYFGVSFSISYCYVPLISYWIDSSVVGSSAGLVFALAIYDHITDGVLREGRTVAGAGQADAAGKVHGVGGIRGKIKSIEAAGVELFLMPANNCADLGDPRTNLRPMPASTLKDAITVLQLVNEGQSTQEMSSCG